MGCRESKHDVAAGNTISLSKRSTADEPKEIQKDAGTTPEAAKTHGTDLSTQKEGESEANSGSGGENVREVTDAEDATQKTEVRAGDEKQGEAVLNDPSSTKEVDLSANAAVVAESVAPENAVEEKKEETNNGEPEIVKEENSIKEPESAPKVDESTKSTSAEGAAANAAASNEKTN